MLVKRSEVAAVGESRAIIYLATCDSQIDTAEAAEALFSALEQVGFGLDRYNDREPVNIPFSRETATQMWTLGTTYNEPGYTCTGNVFLGRHSKPGIDLTVCWNASSDIGCLSSINISLSKKQLIKSMKSCMQLFRTLIQTFHPAYAYIGTKGAHWRQCGQLWMGIPGIYWLNYFGKEYVDFLGSDYILNCDWDHTKWFADGIFAWTAPSIALPEEDVIANEQKYRERLGTQYFIPRGYNSEAAPPIFMEMRERINQRKRS